MRRLLICLDQHQRTVLDCLVTLMILGGAVLIGVALSLLYPASKHPIPETDLIATASTSIAVGESCSGSAATVMTTRRKRKGAPLVAANNGPASASGSATIYESRTL